MAQFDLYQELVAGKLSHGLTETVVRFLNSNQERIVFQDYGILRGTARKGSPPYAAGNIAINRQHLVGTGHPILFLNLRLESGFVLSTETETIITSFMLPEGSSIRQGHYFSYFVAVALFEHYVPSLGARHGQVADCPFDNSPRSSALETMIKRGHLCETCETKIREHMSKGGLDEDIIKSIHKILGDIATIYAPSTADQTAVDSGLDKHTSGRVGHDVDTIYADPELRKSEFAHMIPDLEQEISSATDEQIADEFRMAWNALMEADGAISANMKKRIDNGDNTKIESFLIALGEVATEDVAPLLTVLYNSQKSAPQVRKLAGNALGPVNIENGSETETAASGQFGLYNDSTSGDDRLGYKEYAAAIADVVTDEKTGTPLTIAIGGPWGRGKTKLLELIKDAIGKSSRKPNMDASLLIDVNAWELSKTRKIWTEVYARVLDQVGSKIGLWRRLLYRIHYEGEKSPVALFFSLLGLGLLGMLAILAIGIRWLQQEYYLSPFDWISSFSIPVAVISLVVAIGTGWWHLCRGMSRVVLKGMRNVAHPALPGSEQEALRNVRYVEQALARVYKGKVLIFIDDLDRCSPARVLAVLEAIKLFLNTKGFVFFLAIDCKVVMRAIGEHYKFMSESNEPQQEMGRQYLEKIIQVPFHLPPISGERLKELNRDLLATYLAKPPEPDGVEIPSPIESIADPPERRRSAPAPAADRVAQDRDRIDALAQVDDIEYRAILLFLDFMDRDMSPRLLKRFVNVYMIARNMYIGRQRRLEAESVVPPDSFIHWLALSVVYPFEAKALIGWFEQTGWANPKDYDTGVLGEGSRPASGGNIWEDLDSDRVASFGYLFQVLQIDHDIVKGTKHITNCFNLTLD